MSKTINLIIGVLIGVVFLGIMADSLFNNTNTVDVADGSLGTIANGTTYSLLGEVVTGTASFSNGSVTISDGNYTLDEDAGTIYYGDVDLTYVGDSLYGTYTYYPVGYVKGSTSRIIIGLIMVFIAIGFVLGIMKSTGTSK